MFIEQVKLSIANVDGNYLIQPGSGDLIGGLRVTSVWLNDTISIDMGHGLVKITGVTFYRDGGPAVFTPTDCTILEIGVFKSSSYVVDSTNVSIAAFGLPCFVAGTRILAPEG